MTERNDIRLVVEKLISEIAGLYSLLKEVRTWIGDGENSEGVPRECWTPEYLDIIDRVDKMLKTIEGK